MILQAGEFLLEGGFSQHGRVKHFSFFVAYENSIERENGWFCWDDSEAVFFLVEESVDTTGLVIRTYDRKALCTCRIYERFCGGFNFTSSHNKPAFDSSNGIEHILRKKRKSEPLAIQMQDACHVPGVQAGGVKAVGESGSWQSKIPCTSETIWFWEVFGIPSSMVFFFEICIYVHWLFKYPNYVIWELGCGISISQQIQQ